MENIAVILAGGSGKRFGGAIPKQFVKIYGKMIIEYSVEAFENTALINEICIVCDESHLPLMEKFAEKYKKVKKVIKGGSERFLSGAAAIKAYEGGGEKNLLFHDAARPLISVNLINDCIKALDKYKAVSVAVNTTDTIINSQDGITVSSIPDRNFLFNMQTPQGFKYSIIEKGYKAAEKSPHFKPTDDCSIIKKFLPNEPIYLVKGQHSNIKITYQEDIAVASALISLFKKSINKSPNF